jgi:hypothetical protein
VDVAIKVYFTDLHDMTVPPCRNMNPIRENVLTSVAVLNDQLLFIAKRP